MKAAASPNLRKIAKAARVSHTTVSLAMRNHPRVSENTRRRVLAVAEKLGYRPNALVSALMSQVRTNRRVVAQEVVAFLTGGPTAEWWKSWPSIVQNQLGAQARAEQLGFRLEPFWMGPGGGEAHLTAKVLRARAIRGAVLAPLPVPHAPQITLDWPNCAITTVGYSFEQVPLHRAAHHHVNSTVVLYEQLRALGYRRIGLAMNLEEIVRVKHYWLAGLLTGRELFGGDRVPYLVFAGSDGRRRFLAWLKKEKPDIIVGVARDTYTWLKEEGIRIPQEVAYAHLNLRDAPAPGVAGIEQRSYDIGAAAVDLLVTQLYRNQYGAPAVPGCTLIDGKWIPGATAPGRR